MAAGTIILFIMVALLFILLVAALLTGSLKHWLGWEDEEDLVLFLSHDKATLGWLQQEPFDPVIDTKNKEAKKRFMIGKVRGGGSQVVDLDPNIPAFRVPVYEEQKRLRGTWLYIVLHDIFGKPFGVGKDGATLTPASLQLEFENLKRANMLLAIRNASFLEALHTLSNEERLKVYNRQKALEAEELRKKYSPFVPNPFGEGKK